jgi:hypothetical protein
MGAHSWKEESAIGTQLMDQTRDATNAVPLATELSDENLDQLFGGRSGCGWICSYTGECTCKNGYTICWLER